MNSLPHVLTVPNAFLITIISIVCLLLTALSLARLRGWL
jgi:hypothetical protein